MNPIECAGVQKSFPGKHVLRGVDLVIEPGQVVGLLGENAAGKSTLIKCLLGLLRLTGGTARIFGEDAWDLSAAAKARIGYVPQEVQCFPWMRVEQMLRYTAAFYPAWDDAFCDKLVDRWDLPLDERITNLSPGQLQKLGLVLALSYRPELLILDEPVASLDPGARREFLQTLLELVQDGRTTVLLSTHITSDLERVADHIAFMQRGRILLYGELDELKDRFKRIRISASRPLPATFPLTGIVRCETDANSALISLTHCNDKDLTALRDELDAAVSIEDLTLEEMYLELHHDSA